MNSNMSISRRNLLAAGAAAPLAAGLASAPALAGGHAAPPNAKKYSFAVGDFQLSTMLVGSRAVEEPQSIFGMNVSAEEFANVSADNFIPTDKAQFFFTPTVINTGAEVILFDTGLNAAMTLPALEASGITADQVDVVVLTHMHGDHIGGLMLEDGAPTFPNARYVAGQAEYDAWSKMDNDGFNDKVKPLAEKMTFIGDGGSVASGITGMAAFGHTPGHMVYMVESGGEAIMLLADLANHYVWSLAYPDWEVKFDRDKAAAAASRRKILSMAAADKLPVIGYHLPFPAVGYVDTRGDGFHYVPASYQLML